MNYQPAGAHQAFHLDSSTVEAPVITIHSGDNGYFEYSPTAKTKEEAEEDYRKLLLKSGDVVIQTRLDQWHRGANHGDQPRVTLNIPNSRKRGSRLLTNRLRLVLD